jgi:predicted transcriptional regulator
MADLLREFLVLKKRKEAAEREQAQAEGVLSRLLTELKEQHDCDNEDEGKELLRKLDRNNAKAEREIAAELEEWHQQWDDKLGE